MMALVHTLAGGAIASAMKTELPKERIQIRPLAITFVLALASHFPLDFVQHVHFGESVNDVAVSVILALFMLSMSQNPLLVAAGILGAVLPDIIDQTPRVASVFFGHAVDRPPLLHWPRLDGAWPIGVQPATVSTALVAAFGLFFAYRCWSQRRRPGRGR